jgi:nitric oxide reductase NorD protein
VPLWLYPSPEHFATPSTSGTDTAPEPGDGKTKAGGKRRYAAERVAMPEEKGGMLLPFRAESLLSWGEYVRVNRPTDEDSDPDAGMADEMEMISVTRDGKTTASRVRFDLDLPSAAEDDTPLGEGIWLPEWHYRKRLMQPEHCCLREMVSAQTEPAALPPRLRRTAHRLRRLFEALAPGHHWLKAQLEGSELDLDAYVRHVADRFAHVHEPEPGLYRTLVRRERDLACLCLADLSLSTDAHISDDARVIDVIRDSLYLFAEALSATGDRFGLFGFSSLKRQQVRFQVIKRFDTPYLDHYEGRYGIEDTRMSVIEAKRQGLHPFCVTIDQEATAYLPHLFGANGFVVIRKPEELPRQLPLLYAQLSG